MQQRYEDRLPLWHEVPSSRLSRRNVTYCASLRGQGHERGYGQTGSLAYLLPKLLVGLAALIVLLVAFCVLSCDSEATANPNKSTEREQWIKGKMPYLYQSDVEWGASPYAGSTVAESGCGPTCMSMVYIYLTGKKDRDPVQMAAFCEERGFVEGGMTTWAFMSDGAEMLGLRSQELSSDESLIRSQLAKGHPIIASVSAGDFTTKGHFIVLAGTDAFGRILVHDPNSPERSAQGWDLDRILSQTRNLWAFSV